MKNPFKKVPWKRVGMVALIAAEILPAGSVAGKAFRTIRAIHKVEDVPDVAGPEKQAMVIESVGAATPEIAAALGSFIAFYVALQNAKAAGQVAWPALKAAIAAAKKA